CLAYTLNLSNHQFGSGRWERAMAASSCVPEDGGAFVFSKVMPDTCSGRGRTRRLAIQAIHSERCLPSHLADERSRKGIDPVEMRGTLGRVVLRRPQRCSLFRA